MIKKKNNSHKSPLSRYWGRLFLVVLIVIITLEFSVGRAEAKSKSPKLNPEHQEFYNYARYLFTKTERKIFRNLTTHEARSRFIENFWEIRDPTPYSEDNEFKLEMEQRYEHVLKYFKEGPVPGWRTDRGRIYLILGPPSAQQRDFLYRGGIIQWYYDEFDVYLLFYDYRGDGVYHLDIRTASLSLLNVLENKKHYIVNKEGDIKLEALDVDISYDSKTREFLVEIASKNLRYEKASEDSDEMMAKIKLDLVVYQPNKADDFTKYSEIKSVKVSKEKLLEKNAAISLRFPLELPKGKIKIDALVTDILGEAAFREFVSVNVKE